MRKVYPPEHLKDFIEQYIFVEWNPKDLSAYYPAWVKNFTYFTISSISDLELTNKKKVRLTSNSVVGCMTLPSKFIEQRQSIQLISVVFQPMVLYNLLHQNMSFLTNNSIEAKNIFPKIEKIHLAILEEKNNIKRIEIINSYFTQFFSNIKLIQNPIVQSVLDEFNNNINERLTYKEILTKFDVSVRHSRRVFKKITGITPNLYYRIMKLEHILVQLKNNPNQKFINLMKAYSDQSHFIKDFVRFTNRKPKDFKKMLADAECKKKYEYL